MAFQDFYSKLSENEKKIFYIAVAVVLLMVLDRTFLGPVLSRIKFLDDQIQQQKNIITQDLRFLTYRDRILQDNEDLRNYYGDPSKTVEEIIAGFLKKIEMMASRSRVNIIKISPSDLKQRKGYVEYYANLECEGLLNDMISFMHDIDTSDDLLKINKIDMSLKRASSDEVLVAMVLSKMIIDSATEDAALKSIIAQRTEASTQASVSGAGAGSSKASQQEVEGHGSGSGPAGVSADGVSRQLTDSTGAEVSQRMQMTGLDKLKFIPQDTGEEAEEIKPSLFEVIMQQIDRNPNKR